MKKTIFTLLFLAVVTIMSAQTLQFEYEGTVYQDGQTVISTFDDVIFFEYIKDMKIRNLTDHDMNIVVEQEVLESVDGAMVTLCWGLCLAPGNHLVSIPVAVPAQTLSEELLTFHCNFTEGETGVVKAIYYAYDESNPNDRISIIVLSGASAHVAENNVNFGQAYPNPASSQVHFDLQGNSNDDIIVVVYNLLGQEVKSQIVSGRQSRVNVSVNDLQPGIYFCRFQVNNEVVKTEKFIVKR
jgi:hypothetical protein